MRYLFAFAFVLISINVGASQTTDATLPENAICTSEDFAMLIDENRWSAMHITPPGSGGPENFFHYTRRIFAISGDSDSTHLWGGPVLVVYYGTLKEDVLDGNEEFEIYVTELYLADYPPMGLGNFEIAQELKVVDVDAINSYHYSPWEYMAKALALCLVSAGIVLLVIRRYTRKRRKQIGS